MHQQTEPYCKVLTYFSFLNVVGTEGGGAFRHDYRGWSSACFFTALFSFAHALQHSWRQMIRGAIPLRTYGGRERERVTECKPQPGSTDATKRRSSGR